jgi:hypothetical protein
VNLVPAIAVGRMNDERMQDATLLDISRELCKRVLGKLSAWVARILVEHRYRHHERSAVMIVKLG